MRVTHASDGNTNQANAPIFTGGDVWVRALAGAIGGQQGGDDADFNLAVVQFGAGARTKATRTRRSRCSTWSRGSARSATRRAST